MAAAVGVGDRWSETKSERVKSISWPMAVMMGVGVAKIWRIWDSSLWLARSSALPPPLKMTIKSRSGIVSARFRAVMMLAGLLGPCMVVGIRVSLMWGDLAFRMVVKSWKAAESWAVIRAMCWG